MSNLANRVVKQILETNTVEEQAIDAVLTPIRECLQHAEHLLRLHGHNELLREVKATLAELEVKR